MQKITVRIEQAPGAIRCPAQQVETPILPGFTFYFAWLPGGWVTLTEARTGISIAAAHDRYDALQSAQRRIMAVGEQPLAEMFLAHPAADAATNLPTT